MVQQPWLPVFLGAWREGGISKKLKGWALQKQPRVCPEVVWVLFGCVEGFVSGKRGWCGNGAPEGSEMERLPLCHGPSVVGTGAAKAEEVAQQRSFGFSLGWGLSVWAEPSRFA